jgi:hypothetical protein
MIIVASASIQSHRADSDVRDTGAAHVEMVLGGGAAMLSDMINKIEKAKRYAEEPERAMIRQLDVRFRGVHDHIVRLDGERWTCDCHFFHSWHTCSHIMAMQRILSPMLTSDTRHASGLDDLVSEEAALVS